MASKKTSVILSSGSGKVALEIHNVRANMLVASHRLTQREILALIKALASLVVIK